MTSTTKNNNYPSQVKILAEMHERLLNKGGPPEDGELFENILNIQDEILKSFGLPTTTENEKLLWFDNFPTDLEIEKRISMLHKTATEYLLTNAKSELDVLKNAQEQNQDPYDVLTELKFKTHTFTLFVYQEILLKKKDSLENILNELNFTNNPAMLDALGRISEGTLEDEQTAIDVLRDSGVKYIDPFILHNSKR